VLSVGLLTNTFAFVDGVTNAKQQTKVGATRRVAPTGIDNNTIPNDEMNFHNQMNNKTERKFGFFDF
jgi:hypothetical protein